MHHLRKTGFAQPILKDRGPDRAFIHNDDLEKRIHKIMPVLSVHYYRALSRPRHSDNSINCAKRTLRRRTPKFELAAWHSHQMISTAAAEAQQLVLHAEMTGS